MEEAIKVIESDIYTEYIKLLEDRVVLKILDKYRDNVANRDAEKMNKANASSVDIINLLIEDKEQFIKFVLFKIKKFENVKFKEEYPKGREPEKEDAKEEILGYAKDFILLYALEYYILKTQSVELEQYLKECRVPQAKKYSKELTSLYNKVHSS